MKLEYKSAQPTGAAVPTPQTYATVIPQQQVIPVNLGSIIAEFATYAIADTICQEKIDGLETSTEPALIRFLRRSEFYKKYPQTEVEAATHGSSTVGIVYFGGIPFFRIFQGTPVLKMMGPVVIEFKGVIDTNVDEAGSTTTYVSYLTKGSVIPEALQKAVNASNEYKLAKANSVIQILHETKLLKRIDKTSGLPIEVYDETESVISVKPLPHHEIIPVYKITNTYEDKSDTAIASSLIDNLNYHSNQIKDEWEVTKGLVAGRPRFAGGSSTQSILSDVLKGGRGITWPSANSDGVDPIQPFQIANGSLLMNNTIIAQFEDKLLKYMFALRDSSVSGTNKHNMEVMSFNQLATQHALMKVERFRKNQWQYIMDFLICPALSLPLRDITINISKVEANKLTAADTTVIPTIMAEGQAKIAEINKSAKLEAIEKQPTPPASGN